MSTIRLIGVSLIGLVLGMLIFMLADTEPNSSVITVYTSSDILYINSHTLELTSELGINQKFSDRVEFNSYIEDLTVEMAYHGSPENYVSEFLNSMKAIVFKNEILMYGFTPEVGELDIILDSMSNIRPDIILFQNKK